jgi:hypothetical protein
VSGISPYLKVAGIVVTAGILANCAVQPDSIAANDEALCRYSEAAGAAGSYAKCRSRLDRQRTLIQAASVTRVEGYALLQGPTMRSPTELAADCKTAKPGKDCPPDDATGSIPAEPKR